MDTIKSAKFTSFLGKLAALFTVTQLANTSEIKFMGTDFGYLIYTFSPKFAKKQDEQNGQAFPYHWKLSGCVIHPTDDNSQPHLLFTQGFPVCDNWTLSGTPIKFSNFVTLALPNLQENLYKTLPSDKHSVITKFFELDARCGETAFALKECIAFYHILNMDTEQADQYFSDNKEKLKGLSKEEYIASYLEMFVKTWENPYLLPKSMKFTLGRGAVLYGILLVEKKVCVEDTLNLLLKEHKACVLKVSPYKDMFVALSELDFVFGEISEDDKLWAHNFLASGKKPEEATGSTIIELLILYAKHMDNTQEVTNYDYLKSVVEKEELPEDIIKLTPTQIHKALGAFFSVGQGKLGKMCTEIFNATRTTA